MTPIRCAVVGPLVRWSAAEGAAPRWVMGAHTETCVRCQAEAARSRRVVRLASLAFVGLEAAPAGLRDAVMAGTLEAVEPVRASHRLPVVAAVVTTGIAVFLARRLRVSSA